MKDLGEASYVLGIEINRDRSKHLLGLSQQSYISKVLKRFEMSTCSSGLPPISKGDRLNKQQCPKNELEKEDMKTKPYSRLVGSLMYAQVCTRPDLAYAVGMLARFQSNPGHEHWTAGKKVLRYLQKTKSYNLVYRRVKDLEVEGYSDSDFAGQFLESGKSTSGYVFMLAGGAVAWKSVKQIQTATSTMMAEYIAVYEATCQGLWVKNFLSQTKLVDSIISTNSKHIDLKYYSVREKVKHKELDVVKINTLKQLADPFTKALTIAAFQEHVTNIGILPTLDA